MGPHDESTTTPASAATETDAVVEETLIEEVSIDGMCGVY
jgi:mycofactocin precursor